MKCVSMGIVALALAACGSKGDLCSKVVAHMANGPTGLPDSKPSAQEQEVIDLVVKQTVDQCRKEGLSQEQADCILAAKTMQDRLLLIECPAIKAKKPEWLRVPDAEQVKELRELRRLPAPSTELAPKEEEKVQQEGPVNPAPAP